MASPKAVCIVRNESLLKEVFVVEPTTPVEDFRKMVAEKFQHEVEELDLFLQSSICPLLLLDSNQVLMVDTGVNFEQDARNILMLLPKKSAKASKPADGRKRKLSFSHSSLFKKRGDYVGLINQANTCYLNCLLQSLFMTPEIFNVVINWQWTDTSNNIAKQLQKLFMLLQTSSRMAIKTIEFTSSFKWAKEHGKDQQDIHELCASLFAELNDSLTKNEIKNLIEPLYEGKALDYIKCLECGSQADKVITFGDIQLPIRNIVTGESYNTLVEALKGYINPEKLDGDNQYDCGNCKKKCDAEKGLKFTAFPYILNISLMRFDYNFNVQRCFKLGCQVIFPHILDLSEFVEQPPNKEDNEIEENNDECNDSDKPIYELYSVMVHSGTALAGHYYAYIKNLSTGEWHCFNDQKVTPITEEDVERAYGENEVNVTSTRSTNAYMLVYRKVDTKLNEKTRAIDEYPEHAKALMTQYLQDEGENFVDITIYCKHAIERIDKKHYFNTKTTLEEATIVAKNLFNDILQDVPIEQCRLVCYTPDICLIENSFEDPTIDLETIIHEKGALEYMLLETRKANEKFTNYNLNELVPKTIYSHLEVELKPTLFKKERPKNKPSNLDIVQYNQNKNKVILPVSVNSHWLKNYNFYGNISLSIPSNFNDNLKMYSMYNDFNLILNFIKNQTYVLKIPEEYNDLKIIKKIVKLIHENYIIIKDKSDIQIKEKMNSICDNTGDSVLITDPNLSKKLNITVLLAKDRIQVSLLTK